jgi:hypothetical protein
MSDVYIWCDVLDTTCYEVCQWLTAGRWFSPGTLVSSTNKSERHDIAEILLKVALYIITLTSNPMFAFKEFDLREQSLQSYSEQYVSLDHDIYKKIPAKHFDMSVIHTENTYTRFFSN